MESDELVERARQLDAREKLVSAKEEALRAAAAQARREVERLRSQRKSQSRELKRRATELQLLKDELAKLHRCAACSARTDASHMVEVPGLSGVSVIASPDPALRNIVASAEVALEQPDSATDLADVPSLAVSSASTCHALHLEPRLLSDWWPAPSSQVKPLVFQLPSSDHQVIQAESKLASPPHHRCVQDSATDAGNAEAVMNEVARHYVTGLRAALLLVIVIASAEVEAEKGARAQMHSALLAAQRDLHLVRGTLRRLQGALDGTPHDSPCASTVAVSPSSALKPPRAAPDGVRRPLIAHLHPALDRALSARSTPIKPCAAAGGACAADTPFPEIPRTAPQRRRDEGHGGWGVEGESEARVPASPRVQLGLGALACGAVGLRQSVMEPADALWLAAPRLASTLGLRSHALLDLEL